MPAWAPTVIPVYPDTKQPVWAMLKPTFFGKRPEDKGEFGWFAPGLDYRNGDTRQAGHVCHPNTGMWCIDIDAESFWTDTELGRLLAVVRDQIITYQSAADPAKAHVYVLPPEGAEWPSSRGRGAGRYDTKSNSFVRAWPAYVPTGIDPMRPSAGIYASLMEAIAADTPTGTATGSGESRDDDLGELVKTWQDPDGDYPDVIGDLVLGDWPDAGRHEEVLKRCGIIKAAGENRHPGMRTLFGELCDEFGLETGRGDREPKEAMRAAFPNYSAVNQATAWQPSQAVLDRTKRENELRETGRAQQAYIREQEAAGNRVTVDEQTGELLSTPRIRLSRMSDVVITDVPWLWEPYVPAAALTLFGGMEGSGKTQLAFELAARVTRAGNSVLLISPEDPREQATAPRLIAAGADLAKIIPVDPGTEGGDLVISDLDLLTDTVVAEQVSLVIIDPIVALLDAETDENSYKQVSRELARLNKWAQDNGVAVVAITHLRKTDDGNPLNQFMGSRGFTSKARSAIATVKYTEEMEDGSVETYQVLAHVKSNLAANGPTMPYVIDELHVSKERKTAELRQGEEGIRTSRARYLSPMEQLTIDMIRESAKKKAKKKGPTSEQQAAEAMRKLMEDNGGFIPVNEGKAALIGQGFSESRVSSAGVRTLAGIKTGALSHYRTKAPFYFWHLEGNDLPPTGKMQAWGLVPGSDAGEKEILATLSEGDEDE